jgi:UDP-GlcNAc:undecaprenyl-phosphate GlcNAc-1-phosphate transferase
LSSAYWSSFAIALAVAFLATPFVRRLAFRIGAVDRPGVRSDRTIHTHPTPRLGGLAIFAGFCVSVFLIAGPARQNVGLVLGGLILIVVGAIDDVVPLRPLPKLAAQLAAAATLVAFGGRIEWVTNPFGGMLYLGWWGIPLTIVWVMALSNFINLVDGVDGVAAGVCTISAFTLFFVSLQDGQAFAGLLTAALAGATLGFLPFNFSPAKIFMGDSGAMFLGYALAAVSVVGTLKSAAAVGLFIPILALGLPILDSFFAIARRFLSARPIMEADRDHLHHRLLDRGLSPRQVALISYGISGLFGVAAVVVRDMGVRTGFLATVAAIVLVLAIAHRAGLLGIKIGRGAKIDRPL